MLSVDIEAMYVGGTCSNIVNKETKAVYSTRTNHFKAFHGRIAFDMAKLAKLDKYRLKNLMSISFKPMPVTVPIGDGCHEFSVCNIATHSK